MGHAAALCRRACKRLPKLRKPLPAPAALPVAEDAAAGRAGGLQLQELGLAAMPVRRDGTVVDWGSGIMAAWRPSEQDGIHVLDDFLEAGAAFNCFLQKSVLKGN